MIEHVENKDSSSNDVVEERKEVINKDSSSNDVVEERNDESINKLNNESNDKTDPLLQTFKTNYIFYITLLVCLFIISHYSNTSFIIAIITFIYVSMRGYFMHYISHIINYLNFYSSLDNYITRNKILNPILKFICKAIDFHDVVHHDSSINKKIPNMIYEFIMNFLTQGGLLVILIYLLKKVNYSIIILWSLIYSTIHIINYEFVKPPTHMFHHLNKNTNYGLDVWDILFNTKYKSNNWQVENINHGAINIIILTGIIVYFTKK